MTNSKETFSTIISVTYTNYTENVKVDKNNVKQLRELIKNDSDVQSWKVATQGDFVFTIKPAIKTVEVELSNCDTMHKSFKINVEVREDDKIRILGDTFGGDWTFKFQTVKTTGKGDFLKMYGNRVYFTWSAPTF